jgi:hypothetical protein
MNNPLSYSSVKLELFSKEGKHLRSASGFLLEAGSRYYLITNRHVICGGEGQPEPMVKAHALRTSLHCHEGEGEMPFPLSQGLRQRITVSLYDKDDMPSWIELPGSKSQQPPADVVALTLPATVVNTIKLEQTLRRFSGIGQMPPVAANGWIRDFMFWGKISAIPISAIDTDVEYAPPDSVHVIGYPLGWTPAGVDRSSSAFWRTSSIASEIQECGLARPGTFLIDPAAPAGMAGSPVIGMKNDRLKLLGVYSDLSTADFGANAGLVWEARLLKELIEL